MPPPRTPPSDPLATERGVAPQARGVDDRGARTFVAQADLGTRPGAIPDAGAKSQAPAATPAAGGARTITREQFQSALRESYTLATRCGFKFGRSVGTQPEQGSRRPAFFDRNFFLLLDDVGGSESRLELLTEKRPSDAIDAMFASAAVWSFDCSEFSEVAQLFALRRALGADAEGTTRFNQLIKTGFKSRRNPEGRLMISRESSMEFLQKEWYAVPVKDGNYAEGGVDLIGRKGAVGRTMSQDAAKHAPVGSLVTFVNTRKAKSPAWKHENAISLGTGEFVAWGVGIVDAATILRKLSEASALPVKEQAGTIFIGAVSVPALPFK